MGGKLKERRKGRTDEKEEIYKFGGFGRILFSCPVSRVTLNTEEKSPYRS